MKNLLGAIGAALAATGMPAGHGVIPIAPRRSRWPKNPKVIGTVKVNSEQELHDLRVSFTPEQVRAIRRKNCSKRYSHVLSRANSVW